MRKRLLHAVDPLDLVWPSHVRLHPHSAEVGEVWARSYTVVGYPREVRPGWFEPMIGFSEPVTLALRSAPVDLGDVVRRMNRRMIWHRGVYEAEKAQGRLSRAERAVALQDAEVMRMDLARGEARMVDVGLTITVWGSSLEELDENAHLLESLAQSMMLVIRPLRYQQELGLRRLLPLGHPGDKPREMDSRAWATLFPLSSRDVIHPHGQVLGVNPSSRSLVIVDRFQMASPHSITIGWSGAGKSFAAKLEAVRARYRRWSVSIVDPEGEYRWLGRLGARVWVVGGRDSDAAGFPYDPFSVSLGESAEEVERQADFLLRFVERLAPDLMAQHGSVIHDALWHVLGRRQARFSPERALAVEMAGLLHQVGLASRHARDRLEVVWQRWHLGVGSVDPSGQEEAFEVFDLSRVSEGLKGSVYLALTEWMMRRMGQKKDRRLVVFDEAWHLLTDDKTAPYLEELFRRARKWGTALSLMSQDIGDFTRSRSAEVCLRNAPMVLLLRQHPESVAEVSELMRLHDGESDLIAAAGPGEGLLILADDHVPLRVIASPQEERLMRDT